MIPVLLQAVIELLIFEGIALSVRDGDGAHIARPVPDRDLDRLVPVGGGGVENVPDAGQTLTSLVRGAAGEVLDVVACARALALGVRIGDHRDAGGVDRRREL